MDNPLLLFPPDRELCTEDANFCVAIFSLESTWFMTYHFDIPAS